ncbi:hypothetical protein ECEC1856_0294, partial [Escherichia coli EC1856]
PLAKEAMSGI